MNDITRYEINEHGEFPLSYGRYVRWEDYQDLLERLERLEDEVSSYDSGYDDGFADAKDLYKQDY